MAVSRFCWRLRIGGSVDRSGGGEASGVELISGPRLARSPGEGRRSRSRAAGLSRSTPYKIMYGPAKKTWELPPTTPGNTAVPRCLPVLQPPSIAGGRTGRQLRLVIRLPRQLHLGGPAN